MEMLKMSQNKITVSIVVPVYNTVKYLSECFDSLVNQTLENFEIIIVDDGSNDGSEKICSEYAKKYKNIKLIRQKNAGVSRALYRGMTFVEGKYFSFCGSDDFVSCDFYKNLYDEAERTQADITQCGFSLFYDENDILHFPEEKIYNAVRRYKGSACKTMDIMLLSPSLTVRRLHKTDIVKKYNIVFEHDIHMAEDLLFHIETFLVAKKFSYIKQTGYFYRQNRNERQSLIGDARLLDFFKIFSKSDEFIKQNDISIKNGLTHLKINILLHQLKRIDANIYQSYITHLLSVISFTSVLRYSAEGFAYSIKTRHIKYLLLNIFCSCLLLNVVIFKKNHKIASNLFNNILYLQQGNMLKRLLRLISVKK